MGISSQKSSQKVSEKRAIAISKSWISSFGTLNFSTFPQQDWGPQAFVDAMARTTGSATSGPKMDKTMRLPEVPKGAWFFEVDLKDFWNFHPDPWGFMIQFDGLPYFFRWVGEKPPTRFFFWGGSIF